MGGSGHGFQRLPPLIFMSTCSSALRQGQCAEPDVVRRVDDLGERSKGETELAPPPDLTISQYSPKKRNQVPMFEFYMSVNLPQ